MARTGKTRRLRRPVAQGLAALLLFGGAAAGSPVEFETSFVPPSDRWLTDHRLPPNVAACAVHIASVTDIRPDPSSMGEIGLRPIHVADSAAWLRTGVDTLSRDQRFKFVDTADGAVDVSVELVKAYVLSIATQKTTQVVLRVHFTGAGGADDERVYRGADDATNWFSATGEVQSAFNRATTIALEALDHDLAKRCGYG